MAGRIVRACGWICVAIVVGGGSALALGGLLVFLEVLPPDYGKYWVGVFGVGVALVSIAAKVWYAPQARDERQEVEKPVAASAEEQPTCSLELNEKEPPHIRAVYFEIPVVICALTDEEHVIQKFRLLCQPHQDAEWSRGDTYFPVFKEKKIGGGLFPKTVILPNKPTHGTVSFELDEDWFDTARLVLDLTHGPSPELIIPWAIVLRDP